MSFIQLENECNLDKLPTTNTNTKANSIALPLTQCTGTEWIHQRNLIQSAFCDIPTVSLKAAESIHFSFRKQNGKEEQHTATSSGVEVVRVDVKQAILTQSLSWVVRLFAGREDIQLEQTCCAYWKLVRARIKPPQSIPLRTKAKKAFANALSWNNGGVCFHLLESGFSKEEATANAMNAMIAALDAVQSLVFWTIWNLAQSDAMWQRGRTELVASSEQMQNDDLRLLAVFKTTATNGHKVEYKGLSFLARALVETIIVYPPIFTLPRAALSNCDNNNNNSNNNNTISIKADIPSINSSLDRHWNPDRQGPNTHCASFGLGKRHCPAGTAAVFAAYKMVRCFMGEVKNLEECERGMAVRSVYLGPTLCVEGPQLFDVVVSSVCCDDD